MPGLVPLFAWQQNAVADPDEAGDLRFLIYMIFSVRMITAASDRDDFSGSELYSIWSNATQYCMAALICKR